MAMLLALVGSSSALQQPNLSSRRAILSGTAAAVGSPLAARAFDLPGLDQFDGTTIHPASPRICKPSARARSKGVAQNIANRVSVISFDSLHADPKARKAYAKRPNPELAKQQSSAFYAVSTFDQNSLDAMIGGEWDLAACKDSAGKTVLHRAAQVGNGPAVTALLKSGSKIDAKTQWKETPLHMATRNGRLEVVKQLVDAGASTSAETYGGDNALSIAKKYKFKAVAEFLASK